jgi:hypothetical protein
MRTTIKSQSPCTRDQRHIQVLIRCLAGLEDSQRAEAWRAIAELVAVDLFRAIDDDSDLLPECKEHLKAEYALLLRLPAP